MIFFFFEDEEDEEEEEEEIEYLPQLFNALVDETPRDFLVSGCVSWSFVVIIGVVGVVVGVVGVAVVVVFGVKYSTVT